MRFAKLNEKAVTPVRKHATDAGIDVFSCEGATVRPFSCAIVHTGITFEIPEGNVLIAKPKSGSNYLIGAGVIDYGYQGEILIKIVNYSDQVLEIKEGQAIAQLLLMPITMTDILEVPMYEIHSVASDRGSDGGIVRQN